MRAPSSSSCAPCAPLCPVPSATVEAKGGSWIVERPRTRTRRGEGVQVREVRCCWSRLLGRSVVLTPARPAAGCRRCCAACVCTYIQVQAADTDGRHALVGARGALQTHRQMCHVCAYLYNALCVSEVKLVRSCVYVRVCISMHVYFRASVLHASSLVYVSTRGGGLTRAACGAVERAHAPRYGNQSRGVTQD